MNFIKNVFEKLVNRFGMFKTVVFTALALIFTISLIGSSIGSAFESNRLNGFISSANEALSKGDIEGAKKIIEEAKAGSLDADGLNAIASVSTAISDLESSKEAFTKGQSLLASKDYSAAYLEFNRVKESDKANFDAARAKLPEIKPLAVDAALSKASSLASQGKYSAALDLLYKLSQVIGSDSKLADATEKYAKAEQVQKDKLRAAAVSKMRKKHDSFNGVTWYTDYSSPTYANSNAFYLYFGESAGTANPLRLVVRYYGDNWLFVNTARVSVDGTIYSLSCSTWERDNNSSIWEWCDEPLDDVSMIQAIIKSKNAVIRFDGDKYYDTRTISGAQKRALQNVIQAHDNF